MTGAAGYHFAHRIVEHTGHPALLATVIVTRFGAPQSSSFTCCPWARQLPVTADSNRGPPANHDGLTNAVGTETASEVYFHFNDITLIANLMFHEAMHNKLGLGNQQLHSRGGMGNGLPGGTGPITPTTLLSPRNIDDMARGLDAARPQWTGGMRMLANEWMKSDNDPSKGLF